MKTINPIFSSVYESLNYTKKIFKYSGLLLVIVISMMQSGCAKNLQEGWAAYEKNDYSNAYECWLPLAEKGNAKAQFISGFVEINCSSYQLIKRF